MQQPRDFTDTYVFRYLPELAEETKEAITDKFTSFVMFADWLCKYQDPAQILENHWSFLVAELVFFFLAGLTFLHAWRRGGRYLYAWIGILIHALNVETVSHWIPGMDNFWHAQGIFTLFGSRAPLYVIFGVYQVFDYCAYVMVRKMYLPWWAEGPAAGLCAVMLDLPYDVLGVKLLWWQWHESDPNVLDRAYDVPWNSYYFHASFACAFVWLLHGSRRLFAADGYNWRRFFREIVCASIAGLGAFWLGAVQFVLLYHPAHDVFQVPSELTTLVFLGFFAVLVFAADRRNRCYAAWEHVSFWFDEICCAICIHFLFFMVLVVTADPENTVSVGLHQPIGPCNATESVHTLLGPLSKKTYICMQEFSSGSFDFHCAPGRQNRPRAFGQVQGDGKKLGVDAPLDWYEICGTDWGNHAEYIFLIWSSCLIFLAVFFQMGARSGPLPEDPISPKPKNAKTVEVCEEEQEEEETESSSRDEAPEAKTAVRQRKAKKEEPKSPKKQSTPTQARGYNTRSASKRSD
uniref:AcidPPc domain-containing protein n=1 Tax=Steinernema glaseri TaxID=37863 RepID=A0A1I8ARY9_9BILA